jgi:GTPase SAR1 family protein
VDDAVSRRRTIVLWGDARSGKSGLIGALRSESTKYVGDRWTLDVDEATPDILAYAESSSLALRLRDVKEVPVRRPE